jgi:hypothetical protein
MNKLLILACLALVATSSASTLKLRASKGVDLNGKYLSHTNANVDGGYDHEAIKKKVGTIDLVDFKAAWDIAAIRIKIEDVLAKARKEMKAGFAKLESAVTDKVSSILDQVCKGQSECWAAEKVQCELHSVKEFVQEKRCELVSHALTAVDKVKNDFDDYIVRRYNSKLANGAHNPEYCNCRQTPQDILDRTFVDGMLGTFLLDADSVKNGGSPETYDEGDFANCMAHRMVVGHKYTAGKWRKKKMALKKCAIRSGKDKGKINLSEHSILNDDEKVDECVEKHMGIQGLIHYYGGEPAVAPKKCDGMLDEIGGPGKGRIGYLVDHVFFCTLTLSKISTGCSFKQMIASKANRSPVCIQSSAHPICLNM